MTQPTGGYRAPDDVEAREHEKRHKEHEAAIASINLHKGRVALSVSGLETRVERLETTLARWKKTAYTPRQKAVGLSALYGIAFTAAVLAVVYLRYWHHSWILANKACIPGEVVQGHGADGDMYDIWAKTAVCRDSSGKRWEVSW